MSKVRTKKSEAFKSRALKLANKIGVREAAKQMQCCPTSIHAWRRKNNMVSSKKSFDTLLREHMDAHLSAIQKKNVVTGKSFDTLLSEYLDAKAALRAALDGL